MSENAISDVIRLKPHFLIPEQLMQKYSPSKSFQIIDKLCFQPGEDFVSELPSENRLKDMCLVA